MSAITIEQISELLDKKSEEKLESKITPIAELVNEFKHKLQEVMDFAKFIDQKYDDFSKKITSLEGENTVLKNSVRNLEKSFKKLSMSYHDLEQYGRRECVEILDAIGEVTNEVVAKVGQLIGVPVKV